MDRDGRLNRQEWLAYYSTIVGFTFGIGADGNPRVTLSDGDMELAWTLANAMSERPWNRWGHHGWGVSLEDEKRTVMTLRIIYQKMRAGELAMKFSQLFI